MQVANYGVTKVELPATFGFYSANKATGCQLQYRLDYFGPASLAALISHGGVFAVLLISTAAVCDKPKKWIHSVSPLSSAISTHRQPPVPGSSGSNPGSSGLVIGCSLCRPDTLRQGHIGGPS